METSNLFLKTITSLVYKGTAKYADYDDDDYDDGNMHTNRQNVYNDVAVNNILLYQLH